MKVLLDQGIARSVTSRLADAGVDAVHVGGVGLASAPDEAVLAEARRLGRIVVTMDADFHRLLAVSGDDRPSVVRIRIERLKAVEQARLIRRVLEELAAELEAGSLVVVEPSRMRVKSLPIMPPEAGS